MCMYSGQNSLKPMPPAGVSVALEKISCVFLYARTRAVLPSPPSVMELKTSYVSSKNCAISSWVILPSPLKWYILKMALYDLVRAAEDGEAA